MNPITPTDDLVGPVAHQIALNLSTYITGMGRIYEEPPNGPPENGSVVIPLQKFKFEQDAIGKNYLRLTFAIRYMIRRTKFQDNLGTAYQYFSAITRILSSWPVQSLTDPASHVSYAIEVTPKEGAITQFVTAGQAYVAVVIITEVLTEYPLILS